MDGFLDKISLVGKFEHQRTVQARLLYWNLALLPALKALDWICGSPRYRYLRYQTRPPCSFFPSSPSLTLFVIISLLRSHNVINETIQERIVLVIGMR